ncbi:MAG: adenylyl-sulfate kinase, partial [Nitrospirae bacterium]|nr:adenylyl-sulfate kinase [Nitrospirota bacterium]
GHNVIIDATGHKRAWRRLARRLIPKFFEVYLRCPLKVCIKREAERPDTHAAPKKIYKKGKKGWPVPGIKVPYERPLKPEIIIDTERVSPSDAADKAVKALKKLKIL